MSNGDDSDNANPGADVPGLSLSLPLSRREALRVGLFSVTGLLLEQSRLLGAVAAARSETAKPAAAAPGPVKAKSVIQIFLWGGMSHIDTWDPKPDAGYDYNGSMTTFLPTNVEGMMVTGWFPKLSKQADKYSFIHSMTHHNNGHETAAYLMQTSHLP